MGEPKFAVVRYNWDNSTMEYFAGYFNEVEDIGTEEETQFWSQEKWVDNQDGAYFFKTLTEAKAFAKEFADEYLYEGQRNFEVSVMLFGYCDTRGFDGCRHFPLKRFWLNQRKED